MKPLTHKQFQAIRFMSFGGTYKTCRDVLGITSGALTRRLDWAYRKLKVHRWQDAMTKLRNRPQAEHTHD